MADVLFLLITVAFFAICVAFVQLCDKIIGPDSEHGDLTELGEPDGDRAPADPATVDAEPVPAVATTGAER